MALFIIPPATARLWTNRLSLTLLISSLTGALGGLIGATCSAQVENLPAGAAIILACSSLFVLSLIFGSHKGLLTRYLRFQKLEHTLVHNQFLRAVFDKLEHQQQIRLLVGRDFSRSLALVPFPLQETLTNRHWSAHKTRQIAERLSHLGLLTYDRQSLPNTAELTEKGLDRAIESAKTHRLTELYLLEHADVAPRNVHQYVEKIEEITTPDIARDLRSLFQTPLEQELIPAEPHKK